MWILQHWTTIELSIVCQIVFSYGHAKWVKKKLGGGRKGRDFREILGERVGGGGTRLSAREREEMV
jgi:hypothetical protein